MSQPQISVVMPAYNSGMFIREALASALAQRGVALEVVVVDDGSSDDTVAQVESFGDRVRLVRQANQGSAVARNRGVAEARASHVAFLDADDYWHPDKLAKQLALLQAGADLVYSRFSLWHAGADGRFPAAAAHLAACEASGQMSNPSGDGWIYIELLLDCVVWTSTVVASKALIEQVGGFDPSLRKGQDYDLWLKLAHAAQWRVVPESLALYRMHAESITHTVKPENFEYRILNGAYERWGLRNPDGRQLDERIMQERLARSARSFADAHLMGGSRETAAKFYRIALKHRRWMPRVWLNYARATCLPL